MINFHFCFKFFLSRYSIDWRFRLLRLKTCDSDSVWLNSCKYWKRFTNSSSFRFRKISFKWLSTSTASSSFSIFCFFAIYFVRVARAAFRSAIRSKTRLMFRKERITKTKRRETYEKTLKSTRDNASERAMFFEFLKRFFLFFASWLLIVTVIFSKTRLIEISTCNESELESMSFSSFRNMSKLTMRVAFATRALWRLIRSLI